MCQYRVEFDIDSGAPGYLEEVDQVESLHGVGAVERFVEEKNLGITDERGGSLGPLSHAL